jgi:hypothetical protein
MANYYTEASFIIPLNQEQTEFALNVLECVEDERIDFNKAHKNLAAKRFKADVYKNAKKLALYLGDYEPGMGYVGFKAEPEENGLWVSHYETICTQTASYFVHLLLKHFNLDICISIEASHTCSKARLDAFGGHAVFVTKKSIKGSSTSQWLQKQTDLFNKRLAI